MMKRAVPVTLTLWLVLTLAIWNAVQAWTSISWREVLLEYAVRQPLMVGIFAGGFWFIIGLVLAWGIWRDKAWSTKLLPVAAAGYIFWYWVERLLWQNPRPNAPFVVVIHIASAILIYYSLKSMSREAYERNTENQKIE
ncbi:MAG: hypothetical protein DYG86_06680 [Chloroflexi bacterium CFX2]|nr:hypothetical protein [Chloroflexi bacterium CFX2]